MSNVPSHSRTRRTHRVSLGADVVRRSHRHTGYLAALEGADALAQEVGLEDAGGQVTGGDIAPGAINDVALFARTIRPPEVVDALPTLPDDRYPQGCQVFLTTDEKLYRNGDGATWTKAVDGGDLVENSITGGKIAAGAIATDQLAVGARFTGEVANEGGATPGVFIDSSGMLVRNGKLTLQDEFGATSMSASGFSGSWRDFVALGLYNARLLAGAVGGLGLGRTSALPFWTVSNAAGTPTATFLAGGGVKVTWAAANTTKRFVSDRVPVLAGHAYESGVGFSWNVLAGMVGVTVTVLWYKADGTASAHASDAGAWDNESFDNGNDGSLRWVSTASVVAPSDAYYAALRVDVAESTTHNASNSWTLWMLWLQATPTSLADTWVHGKLRVGPPSVGDAAEFFGDVTFDGVIRAEAMLPVTYSDQSGTDTVTCTTSGTYYPITGQYVRFTPAFVGQRFRLHGTLSCHSDYATGAPSQTVRWGVFETDGVTLVQAVGYTRHSQAVVSEWHSHHFAGVYEATDTAELVFRPAFTTSHNGDTITAAFYSFVVEPLPSVGV